MKAKISDHMTFKTMAKLAFMPVLMSVINQIYAIIDGTCVAKFGSVDAFAGINLIFPLIVIVGGLGFMFGTGGSALAAKYLGEGKQEKANNVLSSLTVVTLVVGLVCSIICFFLVEPIVKAIASVTAESTEGMQREAIKYGKILILGQSLFMLQNFFQFMLLVAEKGKLAFIYTVAAGVTNVVFDILFIGVFKWGVVGAAIATILGFIVGTVGPFIYFATHRYGRIWLGKPNFSLKGIWLTCSNGASEFVNNVSSAIVGILFNIQLLRYYGQIGVSAYGALMYLLFIFLAIYIGFINGMSPAISFQFGAKNTKELSVILKRCTFAVIIISWLMFAIAEVSAPALSTLFSSGDKDIEALTTLALRIYAFTFLLSGFGIFSSGFFTALNNGLISAIISFFRCIVFQIAFVYLFPLWLGKEGIWYSMIGAELGSFILSISFLIGNSKKYQYFEKVSLFEKRTN